MYRFSFGDNIGYKLIIIAMSLTRKRLTLTKKTLFLYQKPLIGRPTYPPVDPTGSLSAGSGFPPPSFKPENI